jgi:hypothetical protein
VEIDADIVADMTLSNLCPKAYRPAEDSPEEKSAVVKNVDFIC